MIKIVVSFSVIFCALYLHRTFGGPIHDESDFNLNDQEAKQNLARFQEAIRRAFSPPEEVQQSYDAHNKMVEKESRYNDVTPANDLDENERYPEVHQWQALLERMDVFEKEHARYREQIEVLEKRVKVAESKVSVMESLKHVNGQLNVKRTTDRTRRVAFSTYLSHARQNLGREQVIVFDQVEYNEGKGYDKNLGVFTCPVSGTYFFVASMLGFPHQQVHTEIVLDGSKTAGMDSDSRGGEEFPQGTNIAIFRCALGQRVWVRIIEHLGNNVYGDQDRFTKFAGFMLWSDE